MKFSISTFAIFKHAVVPEMGSTRLFARQLYKMEDGWRVGCCPRTDSEAAKGLDGREPHPPRSPVWMRGENERGDNARKRQDPDSKSSVVVQRGFVLLLSLALMLLLLIAAGGLSFWVTTGKRQADRSVGKLVAESAAESALQHGVLLLSEDPMWRASGSDTEPAVRTNLIRSPGVAGGEVARYTLTTVTHRDPDLIQLLGLGESLEHPGKGVTSLIQVSAHITRPTLFCLYATKSIRLDGQILLKSPIFAGEDITLGQLTETEHNLIAGRDIFLPGTHMTETWKDRLFEKAEVVFSDMPNIDRYKDRCTIVSDPAQFIQTTISNKVLYYSGSLTLRNVTFDRTALFVDGNVTIEGTFRSGLPLGLPVLFATGDIRLQDAYIYMEGTACANRRLYGRAALSIRGSLIAEDIQLESYPQDVQSVLNTHEDLIHAPPQGFEGYVVATDYRFAFIP